MANKTIFPSAQSARSTVPVADTLNKSQSLAYSHSAEHALAQVAATGTFANTAYSTALSDLENIKNFSDQVSDEFLAKLAVYSRQKGFMKDMPAALAVILSTRNPYFLDQVFDRVIDNGKMVRNFVQMVRSGTLGRKSLGSGPKRLLNRWFRNRDSKTLFRDSVGNDPSLADVIKLVHPSPESPEKKALYGYLLGREHDPRALPDVVKQFEDFKSGKTTFVPDVDFRRLTSLNLTSSQWAEIARNGRWHQTRMNLNSYASHGVFDIPGMEDIIAERLSDPDSIRKARVFPYQLMVAYQNTQNLPRKITEALQDAMEVAIENIPDIGGRVLVFPDVSGSMGTPATGYRGQASSKVRCRDVAALIASAFLRVNKDTTVLPFHNDVELCKLNSRDSVMTNAEILRKLPFGGTCCSAPLRYCNQKGIKGDLIIFVSDNESWVDSKGVQRGYGSRGTSTMDEFRKFQVRCPNVKMVCLDLALGGTTQAPDSPDSIMNIGGFSDQVFKTVSDFYNGESADSVDSSTWTEEIHKIQI